MTNHAHPQRSHGSHASNTVTLAVAHRRTAPRKGQQDVAQLAAARCAAEPGRFNAKVVI